MEIKKEGKGKANVFFKGRYKTFHAKVAQS